MSKPKFLIVGGGFAGGALAKSLAPVADVTLLDRKDYWEVNFASPRALVEAGFENKMTVPYQNIPGIGRVVTGTVASMSANSVTLENGDTIGFDYAAICTGSTYSDASGKGITNSIVERRQQLKDYQTKVKAASRVLIIGGGPAGVEIAAEILTDFPGKQVTIVHAHERLLHKRKEKASAKVEAWLKARGAQIILNERVINSADGPKTKSGKLLEGDLVFWCTASSPNTAFLRNGPLSKTLDGAGHIKVDDSLKVIGFDNLWALGDCSDVPETKLAYLAGMHAQLVAKNFKATLKNKNAKLAKWTPNMGMEVMLVSMGRKYGVAQFGSWVTAGWIPTMLKSKTMFVDKFRKDFAVKG